MLRQSHHGQAGFSLVSVLIGAMLIGVSAVVVLNSTDILLSQVQTAKTTPVMTRYATQLLTAATQLLLNTGEKGNSVDGICRFAQTDAVAPGVANITVELPLYEGKSKTAFSEEHWREALPGWNLTGLNASKGCIFSDNWRRCFTLDAKNRSELTAQKSKVTDVVGSVQIIPTFANPNKGLFKRINLAKGNNKFDIKDVGFLIVAEVSYKTSAKASNRQTKRLSDFVWAPSAGICDRRLPTKQNVILSLSGTGASNPDGKTVYNRSQFTGELDPPLFVDFRKTQIQEGRLTDNGGFITTDTSKNIAVSCNERAYRCPLSAANKRVYAPLDITMDLEYNPRNSLVGFAASLNLNPRLSISKGYGNIVEKSGSAAYSLDGDKSGPYRVSGSHQLVARLSDRGSDTTANEICREICDPSNHYNRGKSSSASRFRPALEYSFAEASSKKFKYEPDEEVGCTACYMKNCAQIGLGTFGPMHLQADQPLDSNIPECWASEPAVVNENPFNDPANFKVENLSSNTVDCIAGQLDQMSDRLILRPASCSTQLPVLCYGFGNFLISRKISGNNWTLDLKTHAKASEACYQMGFESNSGESLQALVGAAARLPAPSSNGIISFQNLAQQGIFIAPQIGKDIAALRRWVTKHGINGAFWVALRYHNNRVRGSAPEIVNSHLADDKFALYYDVDGRIQLEQYPLNLDAFGTGSQPLLFHHVKFKGVHLAAEQQKNLRYLCRGTSGNIFASQKRGDQASLGEQICTAEGAQFARPETPIEWFHGLLAAQPLMDRLPFADLTIKSAAALDPLWVATKYADE
jgi:hypothetical protein